MVEQTQTENKGLAAGTQPGGDAGRPQLWIDDSPGLARHKEAVLLFEGDYALVKQRAKAGGLTLSGFFRRLIGNHLLSRPYLDQVDWILLRKVCGELAVKAENFHNAWETILRLVEADMANECTEDVIGNDRMVSASAEAPLNRLAGLIEQAECRAAAARITE